MFSTVGAKAELGAPNRRYSTSVLCLHLRSLGVLLAGYQTDVDEAGFALLIQLLADAPLHWFASRTMAHYLPPFSLLSRCTALDGIDMTCCSRPSVYVLLYGSDRGSEYKAGAATRPIRSASTPK